MQWDAGEKLGQCGRFVLELLLLDMVDDDASSDEGEHLRVALDPVLEVVGGVRESMAGVGSSGSALGAARE
ncbi:hypothetical protein ZWY2020_048016 [Hordeum vulgare]|nr:hypothetical protein ZWY2020_048016 [Hordeum vulgare]